MAKPSLAAGGGAPATQRDSSTLLELLSDWYWEQDAEFRFTVISRRNADAAGADPFPYLGHKHWDQPALNLTEEDWERHRAQLAWHQPYRDLELQHLSDEGRIIWVSLSGQPAFDEIGTFVGYRGIGRDITTQKRAEQLSELEHGVARCLAQAAKVSEGLRSALRVICEIEGWDAGRCFRIAEGTGELTLAEDWFAREAGIEQLLRNSRVLWQSGKPIWSNDLPRSPSAMAAPPAKGARFATFAFPVQLHGRTLALLAFSGHTAREPDESFVQAAPAIGSLFGQFIQRCDAEESMRESEARFRSLTQLSSDFFWEADVQHRLSSIVHGPGYAAAPVGYGALGKTPWEMASTSPEETGWKVHKQMIEARLPFRDFEIARPLAEGGTRHFAVSGEPRFDSHGQFLGYRGVGRDVSGSL
jgi:PAS domain S-box-containing protein